MADEGDIELSAAAITLLEFTSDPPRDVMARNRGASLAYITSKSAYLWAGVSAMLADIFSEPSTVTSRPDVRMGRRLDDATILAAIYRATANVHDNLDQYYSILPKVDIAGDSKEVRGPFRVYGADQSQERIFSNFIVDFLGAISLPSDQWEIVGRINDSIWQGHRELIDKGLISDPILEAGLALAILALLPFSMTRRTNKGRRIYTKLRAALWQYENRRTAGGSEQIEVRFEAARIARIIKTGLIASFHEATKTPGDEPEE